MTKYCRTRRQRGKQNIRSVNKENPFYPMAKSLCGVSRPAGTPICLCYDTRPSVASLHLTLWRSQLQCLSKIVLPRNPRRTYLKLLCKDLSKVFFFDRKRYDVKAISYIVKATPGLGSPIPVLGMEVKQRKGVKMVTFIDKTMNNHNDGNICLGAFFSIDTE